jgi:hypothetical protein
MERRETKRSGLEQLDPSHHLAGVHNQRWIQFLVGGLLLAFLPGCAWFQKASLSPLVGSWTNSIGAVWMIKADGTFDVDLTRNGKRDAWGKYSLDGDTVTLVATGGLKPKGCDGKGVYHFVRAGDELTFTLVNDSCKLRKKNVLLPWRLKK